MHLKPHFDAFYGSPKSCQMADMLDNADMLDKWEICSPRHLLYCSIMLRPQILILTLVDMVYIVEK